MSKEGLAEALSKLGGDERDLISRRLLEVLPPRVFGRKSDFRQKRSKTSKNSTTRRRPHQPSQARGPPPACFPQYFARPLRANLTLAVRVDSENDFEEIGTICSKNLEIRPEVPGRFVW